MVINNKNSSGANKTSNRSGISASDKKSPLSSRNFKTASNPNNRFKSSVTGSINKSRPAGSLSNLTKPKPEVKPMVSTTNNQNEQHYNKSADVKVNLDPKSVELVLQRISPASAAKVGFVISIALGVVLIVTVLLFWFMLDKSGALVQLSSTFVSSGLNNVVSSDSLSIDKIIIIALILACINSGLFTLLSVIFAYIYNVAASLSGGLKLFFTRG